MRISIKIKGEKELIAKLKRFGVEGENVIEEQIVDTGTLIANEAKSNARGKGIFDNGQLVQGIFFEPINKFFGRVRSTMFYSPYHEFGTGGLVDVPPEWYDVAIQFKGKGIKQVNIRPRPFMYPAFIKGRSVYFKNMKKALKELIKRI